MIVTAVPALKFLNIFKNISPYSENLINPHAVEIWNLK